MDELKSIAVPTTRKIKTTARPAKRGRAAPPAVFAPAVQTAAPSARRAAAHRFRVGQLLVMSGGGNHWARVRSLCRVVFLMPAESGSPLRYRVRSEAESYDRIVDEADLAPPR